MNLSDFLAFNRVLVLAYIGRMIMGLQSSAPSVTRVKPAEIEYKLESVMADLEIADISPASFFVLPAGLH